MDTRGLKVNKDIYDFETRIYHLYDMLPAKHRHTLSKVLLESTIEMRHYANLGCDLGKFFVSKKAEMFSLSLGYCRDVQNSLDHLYDLDLLSSKIKSSLDVNLACIREQLLKVGNSFNRQLKGAVHSEYANCGESIEKEEGLLL